MQHSGNNSSSTASNSNLLLQDTSCMSIAQSMSEKAPKEPEAGMPLQAAESELKEQENNAAKAVYKQPETDGAVSDSTPKDTAKPVGSAVPESEDQPSGAHDQPASSTTSQAPESSKATTSVKAELAESSSISDSANADIQQGYVLVAHPDAGPSGSNINSDKAIDQTPSHGHQQHPQAEAFLQDNDNVDEHGQEVEHYDPNTPPARIQAYARLEFPFFNFYIQKLSVTIGRRPPVSRGGSIAPKGQTGPEVFEAPAAEETKEVKRVEESSSKVEDSKAGEEAIKVKKEEEDKDVQSSVVPDPSLATKEPSVKPEETPRKVNTWSEGHVSDDKAEANASNADPRTEPNAAIPDGTSIEPGPTEQATAAGAAEQPQSSSKSDKAQVDVDLGSIKAVSRNHARLFFDNTINPRSGLTNSWSLEVKGRNGLVLDGQWRAKGEVCRLANGSRIQIAERIFHFVLPNGVGYPVAPPSPIMDEYYEGQPYGYPPTPDRSQSPIIYGSDSDELRSGSDEFGYDYDDNDLDMDSSAHGSAGDTTRGPPQLDENGQPIKRKRGRPKKQRTAEQIAAMELERQRRLDPTIPRRPRGRPPKQKKEDEAQQIPPPPPVMPTQLQPIPYATNRIPVTGAPYNAQRSSAPDIPVPSFVPPAGTQLPPLPQQHQHQQIPKANAIPLGGLDENGRPKLSKKEQAELRKAQKQAERDEKQRIKEAEKKAREEAKQAAKEAKAAEMAEKKRKDEERKKAAAEEAKRLQEEKQKATEREKAERERQKIAAAAAAAELKAKTIADAQARVKADAESRAAKGEDKIKPVGTANEVKIRPAPAPQANIPVPQAQTKKAAQTKQQQPTPQQQASRAPAVKPYIPTNQFQGKPDKPPYSYPALIAQAIWSAPNRQASLHHIHVWIPDKYPFFRDQAHAQILAQAIKQNLAVNRAFVNIPLPSGIALWAVEPEQAKLFDGNTFLPPPPTSQPLPYHPAPLPQQQYYQQAPPPQQPQHIPIQPQPQQQYLPMQSQPHLQHSPMPQQQHIPMQQQQQQYYATPVPMMSPSINQAMQHNVNGVATSASPAPVPIPMAVPQPMRQTPQPRESPAPVAPTPAPVAPTASTSSSSKMPILIARPSATYVKPAPPSSTASINDPSTMLDPEGYPPIAINENKMFLSPIVFSALTAQQLSNLQSIDTKQALNILQAFVVNYFKVELKKRKKAEKDAKKGNLSSISMSLQGISGSGTPMMSASPSPAPSGMKRHAPDDAMSAGHEPKVQRVS